MTQRACTIDIAGQNQMPGKFLKLDKVASSPSYGEPLLVS